jgi:cyclic pyranopterin phosphate synthase
VRLSQQYLQRTTNRERFLLIPKKHKHKAAKLMKQETTNKTETTASGNNSRLIDRFGRQINYLRISVTDRCDFRCVYCMAEDMQFVPRSQLLTLEEVVRIGKTFVELGVNKIRITGGEPLTRKNVMYVFDKLGALDGLEDFTVTTNGSQLGRYAAALRAAGVTRVNISLDSLSPARFKHITRVGDLDKVLNGIEAAVAAGFKKIKLNAVVLKNKNHDEVLDLLEFARHKGLDISYIEEMPLGIIDEHDRAYAYYSSDNILNNLRSRYELIPTTESTGGPARYYRMPDSKTRVGFISPHSHNFCSQCNRVRLTAEGRLLLCLGQEHSVDLRHVVRSNPADNEPLRQAIIDAMEIKPEGHDFDLTSQSVIFRHMNATGG